MNTGDWLKFYRDWSYDDLLQEVETCHKFQRDILQRVGQRLLDGSSGLNLLTNSQQRENLINEVIREKVRENDLK
jgi:hypothetical protein